MRWVLFLLPVWWIGGLIGLVQFLAWWDGTRNTYEPHWTTVIFAVIGIFLFIAISLLIITLSYL